MSDMYFFAASAFVPCAGDLLVVVVGMSLSCAYRGSFVDNCLWNCGGKDHLFFAKYPFLMFRTCRNGEPLGGRC